MRINSRHASCWLAALSQSIASLSNRAVKRLDGSAHGSFTVRAPCSAHLLWGRFGVQDRLKLTGIKMTPPPLRLMIIERARLAALRTGPRQAQIMNQMYVDFSLVQFRFDGFYTPGGTNPQDLGIQLVVLHLPIIRSATKIPDEPNLLTLDAGSIRVLFQMQEAFVCCSNR